MMEQDYMELLELQQLIGEGVEDAVPGLVRVRAEVASMQQRQNGHCYLDLCQSGPSGVVAKMRAVIWRSRAASVLGAFAKESGDALKAGSAVIFEGTVNYSELYGISLVILGIDAGATLGEAELRRLRTLERLKTEGLLDLQKEFALPRVPCRLAVITAPDAAGYGDFRRHLLENEYGFAFDLTLFEATMQGESAPSSIISALERISLANSEIAFDAVLILRGGGSVLDLVCFDDYELCAAVARCPLPVCTAIGHDRDHHAVDEAACISVKTPTAMADLFIDAMAEEDELISAYAGRIKSALSLKAAERQESLTRLEGRVHFAFRQKLAAAEAGLSKLETRITAANPRRLLERGYSLITNEKGTLLRRAAPAVPGDRINVIFPDGTLNCTVNGKF